MTNPCRTICNCQYDPRGERLEYDYTYDETAHGGKPQSLPRIRERGEYYIDSWNGQPWECTFGTNEEVSLLNRVSLWNHLLYSTLIVMHLFDLEWNMDEFGGSSGDHHGGTRLAAHAVFRPDCYLANQNRRNSCHFRHDLLCLVLYGISVTCQDFLYGPRIRAPSGGSVWSTTASAQFAFHVWTVSNVQATCVSSLSYM
jgi:hypothetical protein